MNIKNLDKKQWLPLTLVLVLMISLGSGPAWSEAAGQAQPLLMLSQPMSDGELAKIAGKQFFFLPLPSGVWTYGGPVELTEDVGLPLPLGDYVTLFRVPKFPKPPTFPRPGRPPQR